MNAGTIRVLVVEDNDGHVRLIRRAFRASDTEACLTVAATVQEARAHVANTQLDLLIVDLLLPDGRGTELLKGNRLAFPAIVMTSFGHEQAAVEIIKAGALDYVVKSNTTLADMAQIAKRVLREWANITARRSAEEALQKAQRDLESKVKRRTAELADANRRLQREIGQRSQADEQLTRIRSELAHVARLSTMGEMASGLAHELNQPLTATTSFAQACLRLIDSQQCDVQKLREPLREIAAQGQRAGDIIRRLRNFVRRRAPHRSSTDLNRLIREVVQLMAHEACMCGVALKLDLTEHLPLILADSIQIQQVILNLVRNAIQALEDSGAEARQIRIQTLVPNDDVLLVAVHDSGPVLRDDVAAQVFNPFFSTKPDGLGMGLSISRSIVEDHGGRLWTTPHADGGTIFQFVLPIQEGGCLDYA